MWVLIVSEVIEGGLSLDLNLLLLFLALLLLLDLLKSLQVLLMTGEVGVAFASFNDHDGVDLWVVGTTDGEIDLKLAILVSSLGLLSLS